MQSGSCPGLSASGTDGKLLRAGTIAFFALGLQTHIWGCDRGFPGTTTIFGTGISTHVTIHIQKAWFLETFSRQLIFFPWSSFCGLQWWISETISDGPGTWIYLGLDWAYPLIWHDGKEQMTRGSKGHFLWQRSWKHSWKSWDTFQGSAETYNRMNC